MKRKMFIKLFIYCLQAWCQQIQEDPCPTQEINIEQKCENYCKAECKQNVTLDVKVLLICLFKSTLTLLCMNHKLT